MHIINYIHTFSIYTHVYTHILCSTYSFSFILINNLKKKSERFLKMCFNPSSVGSASLHSELDLGSDEFTASRNVRTMLGQ